MLVSKRGNEGFDGVRPAHRTEGQRSVPAHTPGHRVFQGIDQPRDISLGNEPIDVWRAEEGQSQSSSV
jgi:hypothetical protein